MQVWQIHAMGLRHSTEIQVMTLNVHYKYGFLYAPKQMRGYDAKHWKYLQGVTNDTNFLPLTPYKENVLFSNLKNQ